MGHFTFSCFLLLLLRWKCRNIQMMFRDLQIKTWTWSMESLYKSPHKYSSTNMNLCVILRVRACVFLYFLHSEYQNTQCTSKDILAGPHNFKYLFES